MAIVIEEEKRGGGVGILSIALWFLLLIGIAAGAYYVFFKAPQTVEIAAPSDFKNTEQISKIQLKPEEVLSNQQFKSLRAYVTLPTPVPIGRANPFLAF